MFLVFCCEIGNDGLKCTMEIAKGRCICKSNTGFRQLYILWVWKLNVSFVNLPLDPLALSYRITVIFLSLRRLGYRWDPENRPNFNSPDCFRLQNRYRASWEVYKCYQRKRYCVREGNKWQDLFIWPLTCLKSPTVLISIVHVEKIWCCCAVVWDDDSPGYNSRSNDWIFRWTRTLDVITK